MTPTTTVVLAEPHSIYRAAISAALADRHDIAVAAEADDGDGAVAQVLEHRPSVAYLEATLPGSGALDACAAIKASDVPTRVLVVSKTPDRALLLAAIEAGADGYATKASSIEELADTIRKVDTGEACIPGSMLGVLLRDLIRRRREEEAGMQRVARLSKRERQVFTLLAAGLDHEAIAAELVVSPHTARTHIQNVLQKLDLHSRLEVVALDAELNVVERLNREEAMRSS
jgi:DNA-binding NarL/FixJ family response regulator